MIFIFSYNRKDMLNSLLLELKDHNPIIIDDGSDFKLDNPNFHQLPHGGKPEFWKKWQYAFDLYKQSNDDFVLFLPDDFSDIQLDRIFEYHNRFKKGPYAFNVLTDHRKSCWNTIIPTHVDENTEKIGFVDCAFFANRALFNKIGFDMVPIKPGRFKRRGISSGVGQQLTSRIVSAKVPIYRGKKSLVYHGEHLSMMHPITRKFRPLTSI